MATSAVRDAVNREAFLQPASAEVGVRAEVLRGEEEGRLSYAGATADLRPIGGQTVVIDIGGGSTEIVTIVAGEVAAASLDMGCVRLSERFLRDDPPSEEQVAAAVRAIGHELDGATRDIPASPRSAHATVSWVWRAPCRRSPPWSWASPTTTASGSTTRSCRVDAVEKWCDVLGTEKVGERARRTAIPEGREDVIFGGALVLRECMSRLGFAECIASEADILDGLVLSISSHPGSDQPDPG